MRFQSRGLVSAMAILLLAACGSGEEAPPALSDERPAFAWPHDQRDVAVIRVRDRGEIRVALYPEIAPKTVENFVELVGRDFYTGTTFHRVIPGFMIQGGDPNSRDHEPDNDGKGGPGYTIADEFSAAPHERGVVSMANSGRRNSAGSQFFIVLEPTQRLNGNYTAFGRVIEGMDVVDAIAGVETDRHGRWGPKHRPIENEVIEATRIERHAQAAGPESPNLASAGVGQRARSSAR